MKTSPWARSWMIDQKEQQKRGAEGKYDRLIVFLCLFFAGAMIALQIGINVGKRAAYRQAEMDIWAKHYAQFARVQWVFDEADLRRMYERR